jgi:hypothetical protein
MLKQGIASRESWRGEVGDVRAANSRRASGRPDVDGVLVGVKEMYENEGVVWNAVEVWKSSLFAVFR